MTQLLSQQPQQSQRSVFLLTLPLKDSDWWVFRVRLQIPYTNLMACLRWRCYSASVKLKEVLEKKGLSPYNYINRLHLEFNSVYYAGAGLE